MNLSIIIPAYNEEDRLEHTLHELHGYFAQEGSPTLHELIIVDDGSDDTTVACAQAWEDRFPLGIVQLEKNSGKGAAVRVGMQKATGDILLFYDADAATPPQEIGALCSEFRDPDVDIVIGSRVLAPKEGLVDMQKHRRFIGRTYHVLCSTLVPGIQDTACGCKAFRSEVAKHLFSLQKIDRFAFDVEVLWLALKHGYTVKEVPVRWRSIPISKVRLLQDGLQMAWCVLGLYVRHMFRRKEN